MKRSTRRLVLTAVVALLAPLAMANPAFAATVKWHGRGDGSTWSSPGNWVGGAAPQNGDAPSIARVHGQPSFLFNGNGPATYAGLTITGPGSTFMFHTSTITSTGKLVTGSTTYAGADLRLLGGADLSSANFVEPVSAPVNQTFRLGGGTTTFRSLDVGGALTFTGAASAVLERVGGPGTIDQRSAGRVTLQHGPGDGRLRSLSGVLAVSGAASTRPVSVAGGALEVGCGVRYYWGYSECAAVPEIGATTVTTGRFTPVPHAGRGYGGPLPMVAANVNGPLVLGSGATFAPYYQPLYVTGPSYQALGVTGSVTLRGGTLDTSGLPGISSFPGAETTLIENDGNDAVTGSFDGLAEGAIVIIDGQPYRISYIGGSGNDITLTNATKVRMYGLTTTNRLLTFLADDPARPIADVAITGLASGGTMKSIAVRPATGVLYGISSGGRLFTIDTVTGAAKAVGSAFSPSIGSGGSIAFVSGQDRIRALSATDANLVANPNTGKVQTTGTRLRYADHDEFAETNPNITGITSGSDFATGSFGIDVGNDHLVFVEDSGTIHTGLPIGLDATAGGFEQLRADDPDGFHYARLVGALTVGGSTHLYGYDGNFYGSGLEKLKATAAPLIDVAVEPWGTVKLAATQLVGEGIGTATVELTRVKGIGGELVVDVDTILGSGSATGFDDYIPTSETVTFLDGQRSAFVVVPIVTDALEEGDETFVIEVSRTSFGQQSTLASTEVTILDDDGTGPRLSIGDGMVVEGNTGTTQLRIPVLLSKPSNASVRVTVTSVNGTAVAPGDFQALSGTITFSPGQTSVMLTVLVKADTVAEADESFELVLSAPSGATVDDGAATATITTDD